MEKGVPNFWVVCGGLEGVLEKIGGFAELALASFSCLCRSLIVFSSSLCDSPIFFLLVDLTKSKTKEFFFLNHLRNATREFRVWRTEIWGSWGNFYHSKLNGALLASLFLSPLFLSTPPASNTSLYVFTRR